MHASDANTSQKRRCGFVIRYVPTCAYPIEVRPTFFPVLKESEYFSVLLFYLLILLLFLRILIVQGSFMQQSWSAGQTHSIISPTKAHEYLLQSNLQDQELIYVTEI